MDNGLLDLLILRTFLMSNRTIHWITIILKNCGTPKHIIDLLEISKANLVATAKENPLYESICHITEAEIDRLYPQAQNLLDYEISTEAEQDHRWVLSRQKTETYKTITFCLAALELAVAGICHYDCHHPSLPLLQEAMNKLSTWIKSINTDPIPNDLRDIFEAL